MLRAFSAALVFVLAWAIALPANANDDPLAGLDSALEAAREQWRAPGFAVAIVKDDRVVYQRGFGTLYGDRKSVV